MHLQNHFCKCKLGTLTCICYNGQKTNVKCINRSNHFLKCEWSTLNRISYNGQKTQMPNDRNAIVALPCITHTVICNYGQLWLIYSQQMHHGCMHLLIVMRLLYSPKTPRPNASAEPFLRMRIKYIHWHLLLLSEDALAVFDGRTSNAFIVAFYQMNVRNRRWGSQGCCWQ